MHPKRGRWSRRWLSQKYCVPAASPWCALGLLATPLAVRAAKPVRTGQTGPALIPVLRDTGLTMLVWSIAVAAALALTA